MFRERSSLLNFPISFFSPPLPSPNFFGLRFAARTQPFFQFHRRNSEIRINHENVIETSIIIILGRTQNFRRAEAAAEGATRKKKSNNESRARRVRAWILRPPIKVGLILRVISRRYHFHDTYTFASRTISAILSYFVSRARCLTILLLGRKERSCAST